jgi:hypothetical protein
MYIASAQNRSASVIWRWWLAHLLGLLLVLQGFVLLMVMSKSDENLALALHHFRSSPVLLALQNVTDSAVALFTWRMVLALHERQRLRAVELWPENS